MPLLAVERDARRRDRGDFCFIANARPIRSISLILRKKFYFDELYHWLIGVTQELLARISAFVDRWIIDALGVRGASTTAWGFGSCCGCFQVGNLQAYAFLFGLGVVGLIYFTVFA